MCGLKEMSTLYLLGQFACSHCSIQKPKHELNYLVEGVLEKQCKKLYNWKLRTGLNPPQMNTDKQAQKIGKLFQVTAGETDQQRGYLFNN